jgi:hypothetical protein
MGITMGLQVILFILFSAYVSRSGPQVCAFATWLSFVRSPQHTVVEPLPTLTAQRSAKSSAAAIVV